MNSTLDEIIEKIRLARNEKRLSALWISPESDVIQLLISDKIVSLNEESEWPKGFVFADFSGTQLHVIPFEESSYFTGKVNENEVLDVQSNSLQPTEFERNSFIALANKAITSIHETDVSKVVISNNFVRSCQDDFVFPLRKLTSGLSTAFRYFLLLEDGQIWIGATPELLVSVNKNTMQTVALAGTKSVAQKDTAWGTKEMEEQTFVTQYIREQLTSLVDKIEVSPTYTAQAGTLLHLKTDIKAQLGAQNMRNILRVLHPTPAVCGTPREFAFDFIQKNEGYDRELYAGYLGFWDADNKNGQFYVNLRSAKWHQNQVHIFAGCGVTALSNPEDEFQEIVNKTATVNRFFNLK